MKNIEESNATGKEARRNHIGRNQHKRLLTRVISQGRENIINPVTD